MFDLRPFLRPGDRILAAQLGGEPTGLVRSALAAAATVPDLTLWTSFPLGSADARLATRGMGFEAADGFGLNAKLFAEKRLRLVPMHYSQGMPLIERGATRPDVVLCRVTPPDERGVCSLGVTVDHLPAALAHARVRIAEIDGEMPWTHGDAEIPVSMFDATVAAIDGPAEWRPREPGDVDRAIAEHVARLVPDRATLQYGVGSTTDAIAAALGRRRDLGVHSGSVTDTYVDLVEAGAISNRYKEIDEGTTVVACLYGTRRLYAHADRNPNFRVMASSYTHGAATLVKLGRLCAINSALEVDLTGQIGSEAVDGRYLGTVGGQMDYQRAAIGGAEGRGIIVLGSTAGRSARPRIVPRLSGPVTTPRADADLIVTEWGVAELRGRSLEERAKAMVAIAHPDHRAALAAAIDNLV